MVLQLSGGIFFVVVGADGLVGLLGEGDGGNAFDVAAEHADSAVEHVVDHGYGGLDIFDVNDFDVADVAIVLDCYSSTIGKPVVKIVEEEAGVDRLAFDDTEGGIEVEGEQLTFFVTFDVETEVLVIDGHGCFELAGAFLFVAMNGVIVPSLVGDVLFDKLCKAHGGLRFFWFVCLSLLLHWYSIRTDEGQKLSEV